MGNVLPNTSRGYNGDGALRMVAKRSVALEEALGPGPNGSLHTESLDLPVRRNNASLVGVSRRAVMNLSGV